eukprot:c23047_g1_i1 orf=155-691(+)
MPSGTLEVLLASGHGLKSGDFFSKTDAYAIISCGNQSQKSNVARNQGSNPTWNQRFVFAVDDNVHEVAMKIMDEDFLTADDELGCVTINLATVFQHGKTATTAYNVVQKNGKIKGEVKLSLSFTPKQRMDSFHGGEYSDPATQGSSRYGQGSGVAGPYGSNSGGGWSEGSGGGWNQGA